MADVHFAEKHWHFGEGYREPFWITACGSTLEDGGDLTVDESEVTCPECRRRLKSMKRKVEAAE